MLPFSEKLFRSIDLKIESYIKSELCSMTSTKEAKFKWANPSYKKWEVIREGEKKNIHRIFFHSCIHLIDGRERKSLLSELYKNSVPGGRIFISTMGNQLEAPLPPNSALDSSVPHPNEIVSLLTEVGFVTMIDKYITKINIPTEKYKQCLKNLDFSNLSHLPKGEIDRYCKLLPTTKIMSYYHTNWIICGIKLEAHNPNIGIQKSPTHGIGAFCKNQLKKGEVIIPLITKITSQKKIVEPSEWHSEKEGISKHIQRTTYGLINHNTSPNCTIKNDIGVVTTKSIKAGEELFINYKENPLPKTYKLSS